MFTDSESVNYSNKTKCRCGVNTHQIKKTMLLVHTGIIDILVNASQQVFHALYFVAAKTAIIQMRNIQSRLVKVRGNHTHGKPSLFPIRNLQLLRVKNFHKEYGLILKPWCFQIHFDMLSVTRWNAVLAHY